MHRQTLLYRHFPRKKKTELLSITHTKNKHVYQVYVHIFIFVCFVSEGFLLLSYPGRRELQESLCRITTGEEAHSSRWRPSRLHSLILGRAHLHQLSPGLHHECNSYSV